MITLILSLKHETINNGRILFRSTAKKTVQFFPRAASLVPNSTLLSEGFHYWYCCFCVRYCCFCYWYCCFCYLTLFFLFFDIIVFVLVIWHCCFRYCCQVFLQLNIVSLAAVNLSKFFASCVSDLPEYKCAATRSAKIAILFEITPHNRGHFFRQKNNVVVPVLHFRALFSFLNN